MKLFQNILLALMCGMVVSCAKWGNSENSRLMQQVQLLAEQMPDSALVLLDMVNTAPFSRAQKADYTLLRVQARTNADRDLTTDTEIFRAYEYFAKKKDAEKAALAGFYSAWVAKAQNNPALEMEYYLKALPFAEKANNQLLKGKIYYNIGYLNYIQQLNVDAVTNYKKALKYYKVAGNQKQREIFTMNAMANAFMVQQHTDSAQFYYQAALELARLHNDEDQQVTIYSNMGVAYGEKGEMDTALYYCRKALKKIRTDSEKALTYFNIADIYYKKNRLDSARYYLALAETLFHLHDNKYVKASLADLHYQIEKTDGNYMLALEYHEKYVQYQDTLTDLHDRQLLLDLQTKYDTTVLDNEHNREKSRWWKITAIMGCSILALAVAFFYTQNENTRKSLALEKMERESEEARQKLEILQNMCQKRDNEMRNAVLEKLGFIKEMSLLGIKIGKNTNLSHNELIKISNEITHKFNVKKIMVVANELYPGLADHLNQTGLDEREKIICCLIICGFTNPEIAILLNKNMNTDTIVKWKSIIRTKLDIDQRGKIHKYLLEKI